MKKQRLLFFAMFLACFAPVLSGQTVVVQAPVPKFHSFLPSGAPNASGCVYTFSSGTSSPLATFTDFTGLFQNPNPVILDGNGEAQIWISANTYRFQVWSFGSGSIGANCGGGSQLYQIDGIKDSGLSGAITSLAQIVTINTPTNPPTITTVTPSVSNRNYNIPDVGTGGNFVINPSGNSGTANVLDCTLAGITCKRTAQFYFRGAQCNTLTPSIGFDTFSTNFPTPLCVVGTNVQKAVMGLPSAYTHLQQNTGTSNAAGTITTTYPAATLGGNGDMLVLSVAYNGTTTITGCTDTTNAYTLAKHVASGALSLDIWVFHNAVTKAAGTTVTCTFGANATGAIKWHEYFAPNATSTDVTASNTGTSTTATTGTTASLAQNTELIFSAAGNISNVSEVITTAGYVDHVFTASNAIAVADDAGVISQALTGQQGSFTLGSSVLWAGAIATFKATNGGPGIAQQTIVLPTFYNSAQAVNTNLKWLVTVAPVGTSNAVLGAAIGCVADGATDDAAFNADVTSTVTVLTAGPNLPSTLALNALPSTGCAAGTILHYQVKRLRYNSPDTYEGFIGLVGSQVTVGVTQ